jgi:hypothetical protein
MYRIEPSRYPDGRPYLRVELPPMSHPQLYVLESVVSALWNVLEPQAGPTLVWLPTQSSSSAGPVPAPKTEKPQGGHPGAQEPTHLSTVKGDNDEHGS